MTRDSLVEYLNSIKDTGNFLYEFVPFDDEGIEVCAKNPITNQSATLFKIEVNETDGVIFYIIPQNLYIAGLTEQEDIAKRIGLLIKD